MNKYFLLEKKYHKLAIPSLEAFYNKDEAEAALAKARENPNLSWASIEAVQDYDANIDKDKQISELQEDIKSWKITNQGNVNENIKLKGRLHRRNLQIADLKKGYKFLEKKIQEQGVKLTPTKF